MDAKQYLTYMSHDEVEADSTEALLSFRMKTMKSLFENDAYKTMHPIEKTAKYLQLGAVESTLIKRGALKEPEQKN